MYLTFWTTGRFGDSGIIRRIDYEDDDEDEDEGELSEWRRDPHCKILV